MNKGLEGLIVWQKSQQFAVYICKSVLPMLPETEKYALVSQLRRAAQSIPANIAEGHGRYYFQDCAHFVYIARGSLEETYSHLSFARQMEYISTETFSKLQDDISELQKLINGFIYYLKQSKQSVSESTAPYIASHFADESFEPPN
jgi:four helix bundle protein